MAQFDPIFNLTLNHEGGFQQLVDDGANYVHGKLIGTNRGISAIGYYNHYRKVPTVQDMKNLTIEQAKAIYKKNYWDKINGDKINNQSVAELMFQFIIGSGASQLSDLKAIANIVAGKKVLAEIDKTFTDTEAAIINSLPAIKYWTALKAWRHAFFIRLTNVKPKLKKFLKGWQIRLNSYVFKPSLQDTSDNNNTGAFFFTDNSSSNNSNSQT
jgi:lysozyme family protein